ncbi:hypothetical protein [Mesorhizobium temperatum]|uniref:Uncharacterized protein n=1 Tax=Mesorhizobium temperatum TaxID=241416 RepID=A0A271LHG6_9HYPH|nr:hypothetical protein [Mesorhizobium temperatum]PAQ06736.1 hypothetical protein CIT26_24460 [Mesorhizobium temperatum]
MSRDQVAFVTNALADDPGQDRFFEMVRRFRASATDGSLYAPHHIGQESAADACIPDLDPRAGTAAVRFESSR